MDGKNIKGFVEAAGEENALAILRRREMVVIKLSEVKESPLTDILSFFRKVSQNDIVNFTRQLSTMVGAGLPLVDSLRSLQEQSKPSLAKVIARVLDDIKGGTTLYNALGRHPQCFSGVYLALVKSGETAGMLDEVLDKLAGTLEKQRNFTARVKSAMIYPAIVISAMVVVGFLMMALVIPNLMSIYKEMGAELPLPTVILMGIADFFAKFWWLVIIIFFGGGWFFLSWKKTPDGRRRFDAFLLKIPLIGKLLTKVILTNVTRILAMLVGTGVSIIESLNIVGKTAGNVVFEKAIEASAKKVEKGVPLAVCFADFEFIPPIVSQMIAVGEETGKLDEVLERMAAHFEDESDIALKGLTAAIEPIMIVILGVGVGFLVISVLLPIYNLTSQF